MNAENMFHLSTAAAKRYESQKVPAVFEPLAKATLDSIPIPENGKIIDLACGTGIIPKLLTTRLPGKGRIVGTDLNPAMIEVARSTMPPSPHVVEWFVCDVCDLPFKDAEFDVAFCQQGLQYFPDKAKALSDIRRVLLPGGKLFLTCWSKVSPLFQAVSDSLRERVSESAAEKAIEPFSFRDGSLIASLLTDAGFTVVDGSRIQVHRHLTPARPSIREEILASPYEKELLTGGAELIDAIVADVDSALEQYRQGTALVVPQEAHLFRADNFET